MGSFIATASAAFYGDIYDNVIIIAGSAGSPNSEPPTDQAQAVLVGGGASPLLTLNTSFPLQYPAGK